MPLTTTLAHGARTFLPAIATKKGGSAERLPQLLAPRGIILAIRGEPHGDPDIRTQLRPIPNAQPLGPTTTPGETMALEDDFFLTNLELRDSTETGEVAEGLSHSSMKGMFLLTVLELAARGEPKGAVTVLHDAGDTGDRYKSLASDMAEAGWAVALPDLRGHGLTEGPRGHSNGLREVCRDIQEIQDHLAYRMPHEPKVLVGVGLGANYAATYAVENPGVLAGLVLIAPLWKPDFGKPAAPKGLSKFFKKVGNDSPGSTGYTADSLTSAAAQATAWSASELTHDIITLRAIEEAERSATDFLTKVTDLDIPTLFLHGDADPVSDPETTRAQSGAKVEVRILEGQRHHPLHDKKSSETRSGIVSWLTALL